LKNFYLSALHLSIVSYFACKTSEILFSRNIDTIIDDSEIVCKYFRDSFNEKINIIESFDENEIEFLEIDSYYESIEKFLKKKDLTVINIHPADLVEEADFYDDFVNGYKDTRSDDFGLIEIPSDTNENGIYVVEINNYY